jgi:hypothetical protein
MSNIRAVFMVSGPDNTRRPARRTDAPFRIGEPPLVFDWQVGKSCKQRPREESCTKFLQSAVGTHPTRNSVNPP